MISDEPVRGRTAPPWVYGLEGLERIRLYSTHRLPVTPMGRLLGWSIPHVTPGGITMTMPASRALIIANNFAVAHLIVCALNTACTTAMPAGVMACPKTCNFNGLRPIRPLPGNLLARARVTNMSRYLAFAEVQVEDAEGRSLAQATLHASLEKVEPTPPDPPREIPRVEEPVYDSPDPYLRNFPTQIASLSTAERDGIDILRQSLAEGLKYPAMLTFGIELVEVEEGRVVMTMAASEWYCNTDPFVDFSAIAAFCDMTMWFAAQTTRKAGERLVGLGSNFRFIRAVKPDGRPLRGEARAVRYPDGMLVGQTSITDADGVQVAVCEGAIMLVDAASAAMRRKPERVLATLLFTDIVASTDHAQRLGDSAWTTLLEQHYTAVRREISRYNGTEVATAGDGFFVRFDSPAQAVQAARAVRAVAERQQLEVRVGMHTGECEIENNRLSGIAVHLAARIQAAAEPGEILISSTLHELMIGGGVRFEDRGEFELKGIEGKRRLFALAG